MTLSTVAAILAFLGENWKELVAAAGVAFGFWKYLDARSRELAWRKTAFVFEQANYLDTNATIAKATRVLTRRAPVGVEDIYGSSLDETTRNEYRDSFDKLLNFLDYVAYAMLHTKTLTQAEARNFGWYLKRIAGKPVLVDYCRNEGLGDVINLAYALYPELQRPP